MTTGRRAPVFDDDALDLSGFTSKPAPQGADQAQVKAVSEPVFRSRDPEAGRAVVKREPRRHRTGRNVQLNLKVRQEDADAFYALADEHGWVLGEAFEMAVAALRRST